MTDSRPASGPGAARADEPDEPTRRRVPLPKPDTKDRIFDAAERLLVERGFTGTSLRAVTGAARVNLAAVSYHFGSKEGLLREVLVRRLAPVNQHRLKLLDALETRTDGGPPSVEEVLDAFLRPVMEPGPDGGGLRVRRLIGRLYVEPRHLVRPLLSEEMEPVRQRYFRALRRSLPGVSPEDLRWRFQLVVGAVVHVLAGDADLGDGRVEAPDTLERMVEFLAAGLRAPAGEPS